MGVLDFLFQGNPPPAATATVTSQTNMPDWYQAYTQGLLARSNAIAATPYTPYEGPRVAGPSADQTAAYDLTRQNVGAYQPFQDTANTLLKQGSTFNQGDLNNYMNPYTGQAMDSIANQGFRNLTNYVLPGVNETFVGAGQFGGSRNSDFLNKAIQDTSQNVLNTQGQMLNSAYGQAQNAYLQGQQQKLAAGQQEGVLGQLQQAAGIKDAAALQGIGQEQQQNTQQSYNQAYTDFAQQRDWPMQMAQFMNQQLRGFNPPTQQTQTQTMPMTNNMVSSPGALTQLAGLSLGLAGMPSITGK